MYMREGAVRTVTCIRKNSRLLNFISMEEALKRTISCENYAKLPQYNTRLIEMQHIQI